MTFIIQNKCWIHVGGNGVLKNCQGNFKTHCGSLYLCFQIFKGAWNISIVPSCLLYVVA